MPTTASFPRAWSVSSQTARRSIEIHRVDFAPQRTEGGARPELLAEMIEMLPDAVAFLDGAGGWLLANRRFDCLLQDGADGMRLREEVVAYLRSHPECLASAGEEWHRFRPLEGRFVARCRAADLERFGLGRAVIVVVSEADPDTPPDELLRECFRLTHKEVRVARLLAEGRSNADIAAELFISPHTARHHTERVLTKVGVHSRTEVGFRLRTLRAG